eukprot:5512887-Lingulodinium_polyedra.AAC.1
MSSRSREASSHRPSARARTASDSARAQSRTLTRRRCRDGLARVGCSGSKAPASPMNGPSCA